MSEKPETRKGVVLDIKTIIQTIKYYAIIGIGLGVLAVIILFQLGGDSGVGIVGGILSLVILSFAVLSGPIIAAFIGFATAGNALGDVRTRTINSGIANGIGFAVFGIIVATILFIGLAAISGGGGGTSTTSGGGSSIEIGKLITLIILMIIPNSIVGGGITFLSAGESPTRQINSEEAAAKQSVEQASSSSNAVQGVRKKISRRQIIAGTGAGGILALVGGWYEFIREPTPISIVDRWWELYEQGDLESIRQLYHSDSPELIRGVSDLGDVSEQEYGPDEGVSWEIEQREVIYRDTFDNYERATVREKYIWDDDGNRSRIEEDVSLRTEEGAWKIVKFETNSNEEL